MKVKYLILALFFGALATIKAQDNSIHKSNAGIKGGWHFELLRK